MLSRNAIAPPSPVVDADRIRRGNGWAPTSQALALSPVLLPVMGTPLGLRPPPFARRKAVAGVV
jgi:hypothetical protein